MKRLGLDVGTNSIGWCLVEYDSEHPVGIRIIDTGVRIFSDGRDPKSGASLAVDRRDARAMRRRRDRYLRRREAFLKTLIRYGLMPAVDADSSGRAIMREAGRRIGPDAELGLLGWREQHRLQADRDVAEFGFHRPWDAQWRDARDWLAQAPDRRWLFVLEDALGPCGDRDRVQPLGVSSRRHWWLVPAAAVRAGCHEPVPGAASEE